MATNTAQTPTPLSLNQAEKIAIALESKGNANTMPMGLGTAVAAGVNNNLYTDFTLTSAQVLTLNSVPTTILKAPALIPTVGNPTTNVVTANTNPGYAIVIDRVVAWSQAGTAYSSVAMLIQINGVTQATFATTALTSVGGNVISVANLAANALVAANTAVTATAAGDPTTGTFPISLRIFYSLVPANF